MYFEENPDAPLHIERVFDRVRPENLSIGNWITMHDEPGLQISCWAVSPQISFMRAIHEVAACVEDLRICNRPEVRADPRRPSYDSAFEECGIEEWFAPGDATVWFRMPRGPTRFGLRALLMTPAMTDSRLLRLRRLLRRDFPAPEQHTALYVPLSDTDVFLEEAQGSTCDVTRYESISTSRSLVTQVRVMRGKPDWSVAHLKGFFKPQCEFLENLIRSPLFEERRREYVVLSIRRCSKGYPPLPRGVEAKASDTTLLGSQQRT